MGYNLTLEGGKVWYVIPPYGKRTSWTLASTTPEGAKWALENSKPERRVLEDWPGHEIYVKMGNIEYYFSGIWEINSRSRRRSKKTTAKGAEA